MSKPQNTNGSQNEEAASFPRKKSGMAEAGVEWTVFNGDTREVLKELPEEAYNCTITSPPYFWLRDYGVDGQIGQEDTVAGYVESIASVMDEVFRVLKPDGVLFLNLGDTYYSGKGRSHGIDKKSSKRRFGLRAVDKSGGLGIGLKPKTLIGIPWRVAIEMIGRGWVLRSPVIWHRKHALPESVRDRPRRSYEYVFMFAKNRKYYFNRQILEDAEQEDMWTIVARPKPTNGLNTAPFPDELVQRCLDIGCPPDGSVLDPFAGSGTTLRVALQSGRSAVGIELNPEFCQYMVKELEKLGQYRLPG
jgi:DNA modification methylase